MAPFDLLLLIVGLFLALTLYTALMVLLYLSREGQRLPAALADPEAYQRRANLHVIRPAQPAVLSREPEHPPFRAAPDRHR